MHWRRKKKDRCLLTFDYRELIRMREIQGHIAKWQKLRGRKKKKKKKKSTCFVTKSNVQSVYQILFLSADTTTKDFNCLYIYIYILFFFFFFFFKSSSVLKLNINQFKIKTRFSHPVSLNVDGLVAVLLWLCLNRMEKQI